MTTSQHTQPLRPPGSTFLTPATAIVLSVALGLCGGYLDLLITLAGKYCWNKDGYFRNARDFPWTVPAGHVVLLLMPGILIALLNSRRRKSVTPRAGVWLLTSLAMWSALLRAPLYGFCTFVIALGFGRLVANRVVDVIIRTPRRLGYVVAGLVGLWGGLWALSSGWQFVAEHRTVAGLPQPPASARNIVLIVWDTVAAYNSSTFGYARDTTPNLTRWARNGVRYSRAVSPAPWTYPSHCCVFTAQWPYQNNTQWRFTLERRDPTVAEFLTSKGYQTAGFAANTNCCTYEGGLDRGFARFDDYPLGPRALLSRTVPGKWILEKALTLAGLIAPSSGAFNERKWVTLQSRGGREISNSFLGWLKRRRPDRPFFAFLNYFDAHDPFVPPAGFDRQFGIPPRTRQDYEFLFDYVGLVKGEQRVRDIKMAADCYDNCISFLDDQLGRLLGELRAQGLLDNTTLIITSDHGEAFGDHGIFGHSYTVNLDEIGVPLVILSPGAPAGKEVSTPVSLRDLPATVVDLAGLTSDSPFPGRTLTSHWRGATSRNAATALTTPAFSEQADPTALEPDPPPGLGFGGFQYSLMAGNFHYTRDGLGTERLFDLTEDPFEMDNLARQPGAEAKIAGFRKKLLEFLDKNPASAEVERAYLKEYRERLKSAIMDAGSGNTRTASVAP